MNKDTFHEHEMPSKASASNNQEDTNANLNGIDQSKGAIPKSKTFLRNSSGLKKNIKVNNNIESISTLNCLNPETHTLFKLNSITKPFIQLRVNGETSIDIDAINHEFEENGLPFYSTGSEICNNDSESSSDENDESISDDGCIYTYKGDNVADLPSSFFNLELPVENLESINEMVNAERERNSSPEMDFLEMDFDPGPSGDVDSDSSVNSEIERPIDLPLDSTENDDLQSEPGCSLSTNNNLPCDNFPENILNVIKVATPLTPKSMLLKSHNTFKTAVQMPWSCNLSERTKSAKQLRIIRRHMNSVGDLLSPKEYVPSPSPSLDNCCLIKSEKNDDELIKQHMIWTEQEACLKQITQIGASSCGATAVLNVLIALRLPLPPLDKIHEYVPTNFRSNDSPLPEYLLSRSRAGCTHRELILGLHRASEGRVYCRFFSMYPERVVNLYKWLGFWIDQGAVPIATLNLQNCAGPIPDSWHHQMIFGVGSKGIYLTNSLECVEADQLWPQLVSESVLLIRRDDVLSRWNQTTNLLELTTFKDRRWSAMNVLGQVAKIIREKRREYKPNSTITSHIQIPADYKSGITLAINTNSPAFPLLQSCPELPLLSQSGANAL